MIVSTNNCKIMHATSVYINGKGIVIFGKSGSGKSNLAIKLISFGAKLNDNFSVEIEALTLVMEQYKEDTESSVELDIEDKKPSYMALKQDECNAIVEVTEKTGLEVVNTESFDVNVCLKEIYKVIN